MKINLLGCSVQEITDLLVQKGIETYRGKQVAEWLYKKHVYDFAGMKNLPQSQRDLLMEQFSLGVVKKIAEQESEDQKTTKLLLQMEDGLAVETVLMRQPYGNSVCVSSQVGCAMGCKFCASTTCGLERNLSDKELLSQVLYMQKVLSLQGKMVTHVVIMGTGEPLANYDNVLSFIRKLHDKDIIGLSYRRITLSTAGVIPEMQRLAEEEIPINLSISLHAPNDEIRSKLMPINHKYPLKELVAEAGQYAVRSKRRVTYEYILIRGVNDDVECARQLAGLLKGQMASINLIPINPIKELGWNAPTRQHILFFEKLLREMGMTVTLRREMGADIQAACGQLRYQTD